MYILRIAVSGSFFRSSLKRGNEDASFCTVVTFPRLNSIVSGTESRNLKPNVSLPTSVENVVLYVQVDVDLFM